MDPCEGKMKSGREHGGGKIKRGSTQKSTEEGWEYETDRRLAEIIVKEMGVNGSSGAGSPGEDEEQWEVEGNKVESDGKDARWYR